ncbi:MAG: YihY/virulence factor BrkB family protein [Clostridiales bacterium]|nr:YihY/virulence factor BrkB family protein [Clostridiales bacterium]MDD7347983.1 YihY/virulence factor BrkB family protein [Clostridiales bacterium]MDY4060544.1 YihY/virulence factor BrkB family protein [Anaerovoracaceae bacterium]
MKFVKRFFEVGKRAAKIMGEPYYQGFPAQMAFYMLLSIVPMVIVLSQVLGLFDISVRYLYYIVDRYVSEDISSVIDSLFNYKPTGVNNIILTVTAAWAASKVMVPMHRLSNYTYTDGEYTRRGLIKEKIKSIIMVMIMVATLVFTLVVLVYGKLIMNVTIGALSDNRVVDILWTYLRWPLNILLYFMIVSINYYFMPSKKMKFSEIFPGSIFCSLGMMLATIGFSIYVSQIANYDIIYGSLASIVAVMFWLFIMAQILCLGVIFNKAWADTKAGSMDPLVDREPVR